MRNILSVLLSGCLLYCCVTATYYNTHVPHEKPFSSCENDASIVTSAYLDMNGIRGNVQFHQQAGTSDVTISVNLEGLDQYPDEEWKWEIHQYPITTALLPDEPCSSSVVGSLYDPAQATLSDSYEADCARDRSLCAAGDLTGRHGPLTSTQTSYQFANDTSDLFYERSLVGRALVLRREDGFRFACANIQYDAIGRVETYVAPFPFDPLQQANNIQGEVVLRRPQGRCGVTLDANLFRVDGAPPANLGWSLRRGKPGDKGDCSDVKDVYGSNTFPILDYNTSCAAHQRNCYIGDLNNKCGLIENSTVGFRSFCTDAQLAVVEQNDVNSLSVVIEDDNGTVIACSMFTEWMERTARAYVYNLNTRVFMDVLLYQLDPHDDTFVRLYISGLDPNLCHRLQITERAVVGNTQQCSNLGPVYEPRVGFANILPRSGVLQTGDKDFLGDLTNKLPRLCGNSRYSFTTRTAYVPLFWEYSVVGNAVTIVEERTGRIRACANLVPQDNYDLTRISLTGYH